MNVRQPVQAQHTKPDCHVQIFLRRCNPSKSIHAETALLIHKQKQPLGSRRGNLPALNHGKYTFDGEVTF